MELVALDLEGSGAQDGDDEAILEIATVPIVEWQAQPDASYCTLINPGRPIPQRRWISPGLTNEALAGATSLHAIEPRLATELNGKYIVGHNVGVDWRLLHRRCPNIEPAGLIDTLRLARAADVGASKSLTALITHFDLTDRVDELARGSVPHRALWDTYAVALLLQALVNRVSDDQMTLTNVIATAGARLSGDGETTPTQPALFE